MVDKTAKDDEERLGMDPGQVSLQQLDELLKRHLWREREFQRTLSPQEARDFEESTRKEEDGTFTTGQIARAWQANYQWYAERDLQLPAGWPESVYKCNQTDMADRERDRERTPRRANKNQR